MKMKLFATRGRLKIRLWGMALIVIICTLVMAGSTILISVASFSKAHTNLMDVKQFASVFEAANFISAERGPANILMTADDTDRSQAYNNWKAAQQKTDDALNKLNASIIPDNLVQGVRQELRLGRRKVEATQLKERAMLRFDEVQGAIDQMFAAWDSYRAIIQWQAAYLLRHDRDLGAVVIKGMMLTSLREYAGRLGSYLVAPMALNQPIPEENVIESHVLRGYIRDMWYLMEPSSESHPDSSPIVQKRKEANLLYMNQGLALIDEQVQAAQRGGAFSLDTATFTKRYVAAMKPLGELRGIYLAASIDEFEGREGTARKALYHTSAIAILILVLVIGLVAVVQYHIFGPLFRGAEAIVNLADDRPSNLSRESGHVAEIQTLYSAIEVITAKLKERSFLMSQLEHLAHTDGLTGLLNRRALDDLGSSITSAEHGERVPYFILADIDHFKAVNDKHGHLLGDQVLREIARIMRNTVRESDIVARFGGEEFAILLRGYSAADAAMVARRLRIAIQHHLIAIPGGSSLKITASFGVAECKNVPWSEIVNRADMALYAAKAAGRNRVRFSGYDDVRQRKKLKEASMTLSCQRQS
ncbi:GGDEF domain-containing protein [Phyllobacterium sp. YR531]|uniref:GGDEF domain-containing protein n=1 Tax=Phyllobacterium sp. YR531 TaxID=1144343 RepID=UPI0012F6DFFB|nr:GGDEF domain-containing protein [Phyllobacterium sp. YR531]